MKYIEEKVKNYMNNLVLENYFPGACYAIFYKELYIYGSVGYRSLIPKQEKNSLNTLYDIASLTKLIVTNTLISKLIYEQKINVNDSLKKYLIEFPFAEVSIHHLLTHTSGIKVNYDKNNIKGREEIITNISLEYVPGEHLQYQDINYLLLGFLIEIVYNDNISNVSKKYIFDILNMKDTTYLPSEIDRCAPTEVTKNRGIIRGKAHDEKAYALGSVAGNAGVFSTITDLSKFVKMIIKNGKKGNIQFLPREVIDDWFIPKVKSEEGIERSYGWVIGSSIQDTKNICSNNSIFHTGFTGNEIIVDRDNNFAIIILSNRVHPSRDNKKLIDNRKKINEDIYKLVTKEYSNGLYKK